MGDWKSPQVAVRYVDEAGTNKEAIVKKAMQLPSENNERGINSCKSAEES